MRMKWITMILGAFLFLAPFISGFSGQPGLLWFSLIGGAVITIFGAIKKYKWAAVTGLVVFVWPWITGFGGATAAIWCWIIGAAVTLLAGYKGFIADHKSGEYSPSVQHHHA